MEIQMKRLFLCLIIIPINIFGLPIQSSQTFMLTKPAYFNIEAYNAFWHNTAYEDECKPMAFQLITYFQKSSTNKHKKKGRQFSEYFLMKDRSQLSVKGDDFIHEHNRDIRAEWLTLPSNFNGTFTLFPEQQQVAFMADFKYELKTHFAGTCFENFFIGASTAFVSVKNKLNLKQDIVSTQDDQTIFGALNRPDIAFNKFFNKTENTGFADLRFKLGTRFLFRDDIQVYYHSYVLFPLSSDTNAQKFFQAIRGFNDHIGIGTVVNIQIPLSYTCENYLFAFCLDIEDVFLFQNHESRTIDLFGKPWSRYLLLNKRDGTTNIPAINVLTQKFKVQSYNIIDISSGFRFQTGCIEAEITYGLWAHGHERLRDKDDKNRCKEICHQYGIAAKEGEFTPSGIPATASRSTIAFQAATDKDAQGNNIFVPITNFDLDFHSGASQSALVNRINGAIGYHFHGNKSDAFVGAGGFVEVSQNNAALNQWGVWFKLGAAF